jgi:hypothetical protein
VLAGMIQNHPDRTIADLRRKLVRRLACHGSILSGIGASGKPGAVHKPRFKLCTVCDRKVFADYPFCDRHKIISEFG